MAKNAGLKPLRFDMTSPSSPKTGPAAHALLWRLPVASLKPPCSPFVDLAARKHVSYSIPFVFRRRDGDAAPTGAGTAKAQQQRPPASSASAEEDGPFSANFFTTMLHTSSSHTLMHP